MMKLTQLTLLVYLINTLPLAIFMLMTSRLMSMVLLLNLNIYFSRLIPQVAENAAARALSEAKAYAEGMQEGEVPREGGRG